MQTFETADAIEAQRCRRAQYAGWIATLQLAGSTVTGTVRSVAEQSGSTPQKWIVTIVPKENARGFPNKG